MRSAVWRTSFSRARRRSQGRRWSRACSLIFTKCRPCRARVDRTLPIGIDAAIVSALAKNPDERMPTADAFRRAIAAARENTPGPVRILFAEDDEDFRALFVQELKRDFPDAVVDSVENGRAAVASFEACTPSVVILDLEMPEMDGVRVIERIRARGADGDVPIIVLTGSGGAREWKQLSELGANGFLVKPVNARDVAPLVNRVLADRARSVSTVPPQPSSPR